MRFETSVDVDAPGDVLWMVMLDVESWPELTPSMTTVTKSEDGRLAVGSSVWVKQPRLPRTEWVVSELDDGSRFVWESRGMGVHVTAGHEIHDPSADRCRMRLWLEMGGPLGGVLSGLYAGMNRRYMDLEAAGLKRKAESLA